MLRDWFLRGNFQTRDRVLERELQLERGARFRSGALLEAQSRLRASGLFDSVRVRSLGGEGEQGDEVSALFLVEERSSRVFEHRVSTSARIAASEGVQLVFSNQPIFRDSNIGGSGSELLVFGEFDLDVIEPSRLRASEFRAQAGLAYIDPRLYIGRRMTDPWEWVNALTYEYDLLRSASAAAQGARLPDAGPRGVRPHPRALLRARAQRPPDADPGPI